MESDRVIKNYEPRKFKTIYVAQRKVKNEWVDATEHEGFFASVNAHTSAKDLAYRGCTSRVVEREVEVISPEPRSERRPPTGPSGGSDAAGESREPRDILPLRDAYVFWPEYDR